MSIYCPLEGMSVGVGHFVVAVKVSIRHARCVHRDVNTFA
jgi:hypothetical protein